MKFKATIILFLISLGFSINSYADGFCEGPLGAEKAIENDAGVIQYSGAESGIGDCAFAPDEYTVTIYEMGLCTSEPTVHQLQVALMKRGHAQLLSIAHLVKQSIWQQVLS